MRSHGSGIFFSALIMSSCDIIIGGISVSGYMRDEPGRGRRNTVFPCGMASLVSDGTPLVAICILSEIKSKTWAIFLAGAATMINASCVVMSICLYNNLTSSSVMP